MEILGELKHNFCKQKKSKKLAKTCVCKCASHTSIKSSKLSLKSLFKRAFYDFFVVDDVWDKCHMSSAFDSDFYAFLPFFAIAC